MPLSSEQLDQLIAWLDTTTLPACPVCRGSDWHALSDLATLSIFHAGTIPEAWESRSMAQIGCGQCGHAVLIPAEEIGLLSRTA